MRIYWDSTKTKRQSVQSGLNRVSAKLQEGLRQQGCEVIPVSWDLRKARYTHLTQRRAVNMEPGSCWITPEQFCEIERRGERAWHQHYRSFRVSIYHDAIPLKFPEFTWPKSVARHPHYMKELSAFDLVVANSGTSRQELLDYWDWLALSDQPPVTSIELGADFAGLPRRQTRDAMGHVPHLLMVGILEPRKNQMMALHAFEQLCQRGVQCRLSLVGRVNPHFGRPIVKAVRTLVQKGYPIVWHQQIPDTDLHKLFEVTDLTLFPSMAEGNGLPVIESLWMGIPALVSPIPAHREHGKGGEGLRWIEPFDAKSLADQLQYLITHPDAYAKLCSAVAQHRLPTWKDSAKQLLACIQSHQR